MQCSDWLFFPRVRVQTELYLCNHDKTIMKKVLAIQLVENIGGILYTVIVLSFLFLPCLQRVPYLDDK